MNKITVIFKTNCKLCIHTWTNALPKRCNESARMAYFESCIPEMSSVHSSVCIRSTAFYPFWWVPLGHRSRRCHFQWAEYQPSNTYDSHDCAPDDCPMHSTPIWIFGKSSHHSLIWNDWNSFFVFVILFRQLGNLLRNSLNIRSQQISNMEKCASFCSQNGKCSFWTYVVMLSWYAFICTFGLKASALSRATSAFDLPTCSLWNKNCRFKLLTSIVSKSICNTIFFR